MPLRRGDFLSAGFLRLGQGSGDVLQVNTDLRQLERLRPKRFDGALYLGGVVDRVVAILMVPGGVEAVAGLLEGMVGLLGASARSVERIRQLRNLKRTAGLQTPVDLPRITAGLGDQVGNA